MVNDVQAGAAALLLERIKACGRKMSRDAKPRIVRRNGRWRVIPGKYAPRLPGNEDIVHAYAYAWTRDANDRSRGHGR